METTPTTNKIPEKLFYKAAEVCQITDTQPYVLRFWESEFPQLASEKNRSGQRVYRREDIDLVFRIKKLLYQEEYTIAGNKNNVLVIPAGLAFAKAIGKRPDLEFYQPDKRHPALIGTYLAACTIYASIYGKSPVGNAFKGGVDDKTAAFLQSVAWETVQEYYGR